MAQSAGLLLSHITTISAMETGAKSSSLWSLHTAETTTGDAGITSCLSGVPSCWGLIICAIGQLESCAISGSWRLISVVTNSCSLCTHRGAFFNEAWSSDGTNYNTDTYYFSDDTVSGGYVNPPWYIRFPPGWSRSGLSLPGNRLCVSPWDTGKI